MFTWVVGRMVCGVLECQRFTKYGGAPWISSNENNKKITRVHFRWLISLLLLRLLPSKQDRFSIDILLYGGRTVLYRCSAEFLLLLLLLLSPFFHWRAPFPCFKLLCSLATHICTALHWACWVAAAAAAPVSLCLRFGQRKLKQFTQN